MFKEELSLVPHLPGCYLMKNSSDNVIYVGKSKNLKNRLTSYFRGTHTGKTAMLVSEIDHFEYIITSSELEALLLIIKLLFAGLVSVTIIAFALVIALVVIISKQ